MRLIKKNNSRKCRSKIYLHSDHTNATNQPGYKTNDRNIRHELNDFLGLPLADKPMQILTFP